MPRVGSRDWVPTISASSCCITSNSPPFDCVQPVWPPILAITALPAHGQGSWRGGGSLWRVWRLESAEKRVVEGVQTCCCDLDLHAPSQPMDADSKWQWMGWEAHPAVDTGDPALRCDGTAKRGAAHNEGALPSICGNDCTTSRHCQMDSSEDMSRRSCTSLQINVDQESTHAFTRQFSPPIQPFFRGLGREGTRDLERHTETLTKHVRGQDCPFLSHSPSDLSGPSTTPAKIHLISIGTRSLRAQCRKFPGPTSDS